MSFFTFDSENASTAFELVKEGKYEATITNAVAGTTQAGKPKLTVDFEIRSDVNQDHQGAKILFNTFTFEHEVAVQIVNGFVKACGFTDKHTFKTPEDMANQVFGKHLEITVKHEEYTKDGEKRKAAKAKYYNVSKVGGPEMSSTPTVGDDDLPF